MATKRQRFHDVTVVRVARQLRGRGCAVEVMCRRPMSKGTPGDLLVNGGIWVAIRVAHVRNQPHTVSVHNKAYHYKYRAVHFNLHTHGQHPKQPPDFYVLVADYDRTTVYVLPSAQAPLTIWLLAERRRDGAFARRWLNRWDLILDAARRKHAA